MARAPIPGSTRPQGIRYRLRIKDETLEVSTSMTIGEKFAVRAATGFPFEAYFAGDGRFGEDSLCVLWWLARRANGEPQLAWADHVRAWPTDLTVDDIDLDIVDDGDPDTPGKSEPA